LIGHTAALSRIHTNIHSRNFISCICQPLYNNLGLECLFVDFNALNKIKNILLKLLKKRKGFYKYQLFKCQMNTLIEQKIHKKLSLDLTKRN